MRWRTGSQYSTCLKDGWDVSGALSESYTSGHWVYGVVRSVVAGCLENLLEENYKVQLAGRWKGMDHVFSCLTSDMRKLAELESDGLTSVGYDIERFRVYLQGWSEHHKLYWSFPGSCSAWSTFDIKSLLRALDYDHIFCFRRSCGVYTCGIVSGLSLKDIMIVISNI